jgi:hypothetical protein
VPCLLSDDERLRLVGIRQQQSRIRRLIDIRKPHHEPIVAPQRLDIDARLLADRRGNSHRPRRVNPPPARRQHAHAPVAEFVADAFDHDGGGIRYGARSRLLIAEVLQQVLGGALVEIVIARQPLDRGGRRHSQQVVHQPSDCQAEFDRPAHLIAFPERHLAGLSGRR